MIYHLKLPTGREILIIGRGKNIRVYWRFQLCWFRDWEPVDPAILEAREAYKDAIVEQLM